jgi:hypothetical protein
MLLNYVQDDPKLPDDSGEVPKSNEVVGSLIPGCKITSLLDIKNYPYDQAPRAFLEKKKKKKSLRVGGRQP